ncbi:type IV pilus biogenesis protein PilM [Paenibacillus agricola]|uniref:Pilus assembly protein PilM n=1 Tax=Paenibacillus agricola TaxID=2716264 RepID=A0ABX0J5Q8_9BACL|nr:pilus assembly protein PilM [Paenibacillus agricola]NHN30736.1 pilus assembly protein PilM [Paenibacillus agricola]
MGHFTSLLQLVRPMTRSLGIEITDSSIKAVEMTAGSKGKPILHGYETEYLPDQAIDDGRIKELYSVIRTIQTLVAKLNPKSKHVHMVVPSQSIMVRFLKFPDIPLKELQKLVDFEVKHNIHLPFDQPVYDFVKLNGTEEGAAKPKSAIKKQKESKKSPKGSDGDWQGQAATGKQDSLGLGGEHDLLFGNSKQPEADAEALEKLQCDVMLIAAPRALVDEYSEIAKSAGLKLKSLEIKALSLFRLIHQIQITNSNGTFLVVDVNPKATDVSIFHESQLKITRNLPILFEEKKAEVTHEEGSPLDSLFTDFNTDFSATHHASNDLAHELERLLNFYRYTLNNRTQVFDRVLLSGDVNGLPELAVVLQEKLGIEVALFGTDQITNAAAPLNLLFSTYSVTIGLALRGTGR